MFTSTTENDGSVNSEPSGALMFCCRFLFIISAVFLAGSLILIIVGGLTFVPAEHLLTLQGIGF
jgi:hypothetical protein